MAHAKVKYLADEALKVIKGALTAELSIHRFDEENRSKTHLFSVNGPLGRQFGIVLGDFVEDEGRYERLQTLIVLLRGEMPDMEGVETINKPCGSGRLKNQDSKIAPPNQSCVFVADELALKRLLRWYASRPGT